MHSVMDPAAEAAPPSPGAQAPQTSALRLSLLRLVPALGIGAATFIPAGTLRWPGGWLGVVLVVGGIIGQDMYVRRRNPGLMERRTRAGAGTPRWDRALMAYAHLCTIALFLVAGWDGARRYPGFPPPSVWLAGLALWGVGQWLVAWAMGTNAFFEGTIRLQEDVGHHVIDRGPYAILRHPGYAGLIVYYFGIPLLFGSLRAVIPAALTLLWLLPRTIAQDRFLRVNLPGYMDYARRVRARLVPGVW